jgi:integrase
VRGYKQSLTLRVIPTLGREPISDVRRADLQAIVDDLAKDGLGASTSQMTIVPLKAIFRRELSRGRLTTDPTAGLDLPAIRGGRDRIVSPKQAEALIAALEPRDQVLWATALYAGLRRGELMALLWEDVDFENGVIHVRRSWDPAEAADVGPSRGRGDARCPSPRC